MIYASGFETLSAGTYSIYFPKISKILVGFCHENKMIRAVDFSSHQLFLYDMEIDIHSQNGLMKF
jgi:hypothetical protein